MLIDRARAKINLTLHIEGRRPDGWHALESLVCFAGKADALTLIPGGALSLAVDGPTAMAAGDGDDNLVLRAARNLAGLVPGLTMGAFHLTKRLPVAAGVGGIHVSEDGGRFCLPNATRSRSPKSHPAALSNSDSHSRAASWCASSGARRGGWRACVPRAGFLRAGAVSAPRACGARALHAPAGTTVSRGADAAKKPPPETRG